MTTTEHSPLIARAAPVIGDAWTLRILSESLAGRTRFNQLVATTGITKNILANKLTAMVENGLLDRVPVSEGSKRFHYPPGPRGVTFAPILDEIGKWYGTGVSRMAIVDTETNDGGEK